MNKHDLIYPMFAMVCLTFIVLIALFRNRVQSVRNGEISSYYFKTYQGEEESISSLKLSQHFSNIFESPTLFYVACLAAMIVDENTTTLYSLAWFYVLLRATHAYIHIGKNKLKPRIAAYMLSWIVLLMMWGKLVFSIAHLS